MNDMWAYRPGKRSVTQAHCEQQEYARIFFPIAMGRDMSVPLNN